MIQLDITLANGARASCHILEIISLRRPFDYRRLTVQSYSSTEAYMAGAPYIFTDDFIMPEDAVEGDVDASSLAWLVLPAGPFPGTVLRRLHGSTLVGDNFPAWERASRQHKPGQR